MFFDILIHWINLNSGILKPQYIFGTAIGDTSSKRPDEVYADVVKITEHLQRQYTCLPLASLSSSSSQCRSFLGLGSHTHFVNYGGTVAVFNCADIRIILLMVSLKWMHYRGCVGGYYSYLFARMYAAQIWKTHFEHNPLSRYVMKPIGYIILRIHLFFLLSVITR